MGGIQRNLVLNSVVARMTRDREFMTDKRMENVAALSHGLHAATLATGALLRGVSISLKYITSKGILLRLVGCILTEFLLCLLLFFF